MIVMFDFWIYPKCKPSSDERKEKNNYHFLYSVAIQKSVVTCIGRRVIAGSSPVALTISRPFDEDYRTERRRSQVRVLPSQQISYTWDVAQMVEQRKNIFVNNLPTLYGGLARNWYRTCLENRLP